MTGRSTARTGRRFTSAAGLALLVAACDSAIRTPLATGGTATTGAASATPAPAATATAGATPAHTPISTAPPAYDRNPAAYVEGVPYEPVIDPAAFEDRITHPFLPFKPGARWVFGGDERIVVEVLEETKEILGIQATVVRDRVFEDGELIEDTLDWYGQDVGGNVWYLGEETAEYENGEVVSTAGSWEAGVDGAQPGIIMLADPHVGDTYRQEFYLGEAEDLAQITALTGEISVRAGSWSGDDVLVTEEWTPLEPGVREQKTYAIGVGVVEARTIEGGNDVVFLRSYTIP
jgi:hypothetical protein